MTALIIVGIICLVGLVSLVHAIKNAPTINDDISFENKKTEKP